MLEQTFSLSELEAFAETFIASLERAENHACVVGLYGELGSGKTTFVQRVASALGVSDDVTSPTFVIERTYPLQGERFERLVHIDAYRLEKSEELEVLHWRDRVETAGNLIFVEWADRVERILPSHTCKLTFAYLDKTRRKVTWHEKRA